MIADQQTAPDCSQTENRADELPGGIKLEPITTLEKQKEETIREMRNTLVQAAKQFATYAQNHLAKSPPDYYKAEVNAKWATTCDLAVKDYDNAKA
jgi:hypothetical protein